MTNLLDQFLRTFLSYIEYRHYYGEESTWTKEAKKQFNRFFGDDKHKVLDELDLLKKFVLETQALLEGFRFSVVFVTQDVETEPYRVMLTNPKKCEDANSETLVKSLEEIEGILKDE